MRAVVVAALVVAGSATAASAAASSCEPVALTLQGGALRLALERGDGQQADLPWVVRVQAAIAPGPGWAGAAGERGDASLATVFRTVHGAGGAFLALASGDFGGASHNGNFNVTGWLPSAATTVQTVDACGSNATALWVAGTVAGLGDASSSFSFSSSSSSSPSSSSSSLSSSSSFSYNFTAGASGGLVRLDVIVAEGRGGAAGGGGLPAERDVRRGAAVVDTGAGNVRRVLLRFATSDADEGPAGAAGELPASYYGAGEQYTRVNLSGSFVPILTTEQGVGRDAPPPVAPTPAVSQRRAPPAAASAAAPEPAPPETQLVWLTQFLNDFGGGAGGSWQTTYTALPLFVGDDGVGLYVDPSAAATVSNDSAATVTTTAPPVSLDFRNAPRALEAQVLALEWSAWVFWPRRQLPAPATQQQPPPPPPPQQQQQRQQGHVLSTTIAIRGNVLIDNPRTDPTPVLLGVEALTGAVGRVSAGPPAWVDSGAIVALEGGTAAVQRDLGRLLDWGVPVAAVWIQDWSGRRTDQFGSRLWWNWELDTELYANWTGLRAFCAANGGVRLLAYLNPYLAASGRTGLFDAAAAAGHLLRNSTGAPLVLSSGSDGFTFGTVDLASTAARDWFVDSVIVPNVLGSGFSGWMADFGEYVPLGGVHRSANFSSCASSDAACASHGRGDEDVGLSLHNAFPGLWAQTNYAVRARVDALAAAAAAAAAAAVPAVAVAAAKQREAAQPLREGMDGSIRSGTDVLYFSRSASPASLRHASVFWAGDQLVSWDGFDGLRSCLSAYLSAGFSGMTLMSSDVGGYTMQQYSAAAGSLPSPPFPADAVVNFTRTPLLLARWAEFAAFADSIFRSHVGNLPAVSAQVYDSSAAAAQFGFSARVHGALAAYRRELVAEAVARGWPLVRHMAMEYPTAAAAAAAVSGGAEELAQFALGRDVIVAPVVDAGAATVRVHLPAVADGPWMTVRAAGTPPVPAAPPATGEQDGVWVTVPVAAPGVGRVAPFFFRNRTRSAGLRQFVEWLVAA